MYENGEAFSGKVSVEGIYRPYMLNTWTGKTEEQAEFSYVDGRTVLNVELDAGDIVLFALDPNDRAEVSVIAKANVAKAVVENGHTVLYIPETGDASVEFSDGTSYACRVEVHQISLDGLWSLTVEAWEPGEKLVRTEKRNGVTKTEVTYTTDKRDIDVGPTELIPWTEMEAVGETVSGMGCYTNSFVLPEEWSGSENALVFDAQSFGGSSAALWVNGEKVDINIINGEADISDYVHAGANDIRVRVATSLTNRMMATGYSGWSFFSPTLVSYGMQGEAQLKTYSRKTVD